MPIRSDRRPRPNGIIGRISAAAMIAAPTFWAELAPGTAIMVTVLGFNLLGDGVRDVLDPRLRT